MIGWRKISFEGLSVPEMGELRYVLSALVSFMQHFIGRVHPVAFQT